MTDTHETREREHEQSNADATKPHPYMYLDDQGYAHYRPLARAVTEDLAHQIDNVCEIERRLMAHGMGCYHVEPLILAKNIASRMRIERTEDMRFELVGILAGDKGRRYRVLISVCRPKVNQGQLYESSSDVSRHTDEHEAVALLEGDVLTFSEDCTEVRLWTHLSNFTDRAEREIGSSADW